MGWATLFLLPTLLSVLVFTVFPVVYSLLISFWEWNVVRPPLTALTREAQEQLFGAVAALCFELDATAATA